MPGTVGVYFVQFLLNSGLAPNNATQLTIAQQAFVNNVVTFPIQVPGLATSFVITPASVSVAPGSPLSFTITALDAQGKPTPTYTGTIHLTSSDSAATLTAGHGVDRGNGHVQHHVPDSRISDCFGQRHHYDHYCGHVAGSQRNQRDEWHFCQTGSERAYTTVGAIPALT